MQKETESKDRDRNQTNMLHIQKIKLILKEKRSIKISRFPTGLDIQKDHFM